jgi:enoyl-CoA hydratase
VLFTSHRLAPAEDVVCGMVSRLVERAASESEKLALANQIAKAPPFALKLAKRSLYGALDIQACRAAPVTDLDTRQLSRATQEFRSTRERRPGTRIERGKASMR